jgi:hypothetical protein
MARAQCEVGSARLVRRHPAGCLGFGLSIAEKGDKMPALPTVGLPPGRLPALAAFRRQVS